MTKECWRWPERTWISPDVDWRDADVVTAGIDVGSVSSKALILVDGKVQSFNIMRTGSDSYGSAEKAYTALLEASGVPRDRIDAVVGTGYGRVNIPFADRAVTEIACLALGAHRIFGKRVRTVLDIGGQDCKAVRCDENGRVVDFVMNDKCAAGTGRGMETFADLLQVPVERIGEVSLDVDEEPEPVSSTCVVFAKSEALGLLRKGWGKSEVLAAYCAAMAHRISTLLERLGVERDLVVTGGTAKNRGVVERLGRKLGMRLLVPSGAECDPQLVGALGAASFAEELLRHKKSKK